MKRFLIALQFLTIIPIRLKGIAEEDYAKSRVFFPLAGIIIGVILVLFNSVISLLMPAMAANAFLLIFWIFITGALHLDGLADTVDGFYAGTKKEEILRVMEDTSTGAKGAAALVMILLFKFTLLLNIQGPMKIYALILAPAISRYSMFMAIVNSGPARNNGIGRLFTGTASRTEIFFSFLIIAAIACLSFYFLPVKMLGFAALAAALIVTVYFVRYCDYKIGGMTGDTLGALNEIAEVTVLAVIVAVGFMRGGINVP